MKIALLFTFIGIIFFFQSLHGQEQDWDKTPALRDDRLVDMLMEPKMMYKSYYNSGPLEEIFIDRRQGITQEHKNNLARYRGFYEEGENLELFCHINNRPIFGSSMERSRFIRTILSSVQLFGLEMTMNALGGYARSLGFEALDFETMADNLVDQYCSKNITVMGLKKLRFLFKSQFQEELTHSLPDVSSNPLFPSSLDAINSSDNFLEQEMAQTLELFKMFCSWGNSTDNFREMTFFLKNPIIYEYFVRALSGVDLKWDEQKKGLYKVPVSEAPYTYCDGHICRQVSKEEFLRSVPKAMGSEDVAGDMRRLYCQDIRFKQYEGQRDDPRIAEWISKKSQDDHNLMIGQFIALVTGVPDFFVRASLYSDIEKFMDASLDHYMDSWAKNEGVKYSDYLYFEEPLHLKISKKEGLVNRYSNHFEIFLEADLGEFDQMVNFLGKLKVTMNLPLSRELMAWAQRMYMFIDRMSEGNESLLEVHKRIKAQVSLERKKQEKKLFFPPWNDKIDELLTNEILNILLKKRGRIDHMGAPKEIMVSINISISPFALKYIHFQYLIDKRNMDPIISNEKMH